MTIDEAIAENLRIAEGQDKCAEISVSEHAKERMKVCADEHRQLAEWLRELKEAKRLLQLAWDDIQTLNDATANDEGNCLIEDNFESCTECPLFCGSKKYCGWRYQVDALVLLGGEENGTQTVSDM